MTLVPNVLQSSRSKQTIATIISTLSLTTVGFISGWLSPAEERLLSDDPPVNLTYSELSWIMSAAHQGAMISPIPAAVLMDSLGRRNTLLVLNSLPVLGWLLTFLAQDFIALYIARFITGTWIGIATAVGPVYIGEVVEPRFRSFLSSFLYLMRNSGVVLIFTISMYVSYSQLAAYSLLFSLFAWSVMFLIPESPYFYCMKNKTNLALDSLKWLRGGENIDDEYKNIEKFVEIGSKSKTKCKDFCSNPGTVKAFIIVITLAILFRTNGSDFLNLLSVIVPKKAFFSITNDDCAIIVASVYLLGCIRPRCITSLGIRPLLMISGMGCGICMSTMAAWEYFKHTSDYVKNDLYWIPFVCFVIHAIFCAMGIGPIAVAIRGELFPTEQKAYLSSIATVVGYGCSVLVLKMFISVRANLGSHYNFIIPSVSSFILVLFTYFYVIETEGKSLQEIQIELSASAHGSLTGSTSKNSNNL